MPGDARGVKRALASELRRLRAWPAAWAVMGAWLVLSFLFAYVFPLVAYRTGAPGIAGSEVGRLVLGLELSPGEAPAVAIRSMPLFGGAMMTVLGVLVTGSGYTWGTWKSAATQTLSRRSLIAGSLLAATCVCAALVAAVLLLSLATASTIALTVGLDHRLPPAGSWINAGTTGFLVLEMWLLSWVAHSVVVCRSTGLPLGLALVDLRRGEPPTRCRAAPARRPPPDRRPARHGHRIPGGSRNGPGLGQQTPGILTDISGARALLTILIYATIAALTAYEVFARRDLN